MSAQPVIDAARSVAEWLDDNGQRKRAEDIRRLCRSNSGLRNTLSQLHKDNMALRDASARMPQ